MGAEACKAVRIYVCKGRRELLELECLLVGSPPCFQGHVLLGAAKPSRGGIWYRAARSILAVSALADQTAIFPMRSSQAGVKSIHMSSLIVVSCLVGPEFLTAASHTYPVPFVDPTMGFIVVFRGMAGRDTTRGDDKLQKAVVQLAAKKSGVVRVVTAGISTTVH